ncbi:MULTISPECIES: OmpA/MotB family protein [Aeromonas]|uniref:OmpA/MotB family protein n=1 Tax=Aeromonas TaxID=642 RepID=UPI000640A6E1|nr:MULTISPECIES: OmpA family protein [Aeromonas]HEH9401340.1 OmpA family protein [Aeromonas sobria]AKJ35813.1 ompA [Aeromonas hydrophila NJ-35]EKP0299100.1 OmpA family protein [Aeromonas veronii]MCS3791219.1 outer membrane protein OmpA-like peptidoglycan-associated protein [Aeromonas hydrophila]OLF58674.1 cell envelope biogenesis protein OmpA [Aeromonas veronii]
MDKLFGTSNTSHESGEHWLTVSDLMAGLMMVFLFIAIVFMMNTQKENDKIKDVAVAYQQNQVAIYEALQTEFKDDLNKWGATIDKETLAFSFQSPDVLFANNETTLSEAYKNILNDFFPRYIDVLRPYRESLNEIRIEGHTSSAGLRGATEAQAYFYNMRLSQGRTRAVLEYAYALMPNESAWIKANIAAVGFSSSRLIMKDGMEDAAQSRRVSFRAITNADIQIKRILESH